MQGKTSWIIQTCKLENTQNLVIYLVCRFQSRIEPSTFCITFPNLSKTNTHDTYESSFGGLNSPEKIHGCAPKCHWRDDQLQTPSASLPHYTSIL